MRRGGKTAVETYSGTLPPDSSTLIDDYSRQIVLRRETLTEIANVISSRIGRKMDSTEVAQLMRYVEGMPPRAVKNVPKEIAVQRIANGFIERHKIAHDLVREEEDIGHTTGLYEITPTPTVQEYLRAEVSELSPNENPLKLSMFPDRQGHSILSADQYTADHQLGQRSTPNNILPKAILEQRAFEMQEQSLKAMMSIAKTLAPESINDILSRNKAACTSYDSVVLARQTLPLDSRYRLKGTDYPAEYRWNLNFTGQTGQVGIIWAFDNLQQIIEIKVSSFWIPIKSPVDQYYSKIRMFIREFQRESIRMVGFKNSIPFVGYYHFEFEAIREEVGRLYLKPIDPVYRFKTPFARVESLTISFYSPVDVIIPVPDSMFMTISNTNPAVLTSTDPHNLQTGDLIYIESVSTGDALIDRELKRAEGWYCTRLNDFQISITIDLTSLPGPTPNAEVFFGSKRLIFDLGFVSLEQ